MTDRSQAKREGAYVALGSLIYALIFSYSLLPHLRERGSLDDWDSLNSLEWVPYYTITHFHQFPLWDPYKCGGMPALGDPLSTFLTPFLSLDLLFGPVVGMHLDAILHLAIAFSGGYVLARSLGLEPLAAVACGAIFPSTSWFYLHIAAGHHSFVSAAYLPWIALLLWLSVERKSLTASALAGLLIALSFLKGGMYIALYSGFLVAFLTCGFAILTISFQPLISALMVGIFAFGIAAIKLLPMLELFKVHARPIERWFMITPDLLLPFLFSRYQDVTRGRVVIFGHESYSFYEYGAYVSIPFVVLAAMEVFSNKLRSLPWLLTAAMFLLLSLGDLSPYWLYFSLRTSPLVGKTIMSEPTWFQCRNSIWNVLRSLPLIGGLFGAARFHTRCLIGFVLSIAALASMGVEFLCTKFGRRGRVIATALLVAGVTDAWLVGPPSLYHVFDEPLRNTPLPIAVQFQQSLGHRYNMTAAEQANMGILGCYAYIDLSSNASAPGQPGYRGEQYLLGLGLASLLQWTPNALSYKVDAPLPTVLVVNQNYYPGWRLTEGNGEIFSQNGLLAVRLPAGRQRLELVFRNTHFLTGLGITLITLLGILLLWRYEHSRGRRFAKIACISGADGNPDLRRRTLKAPA